MNRLRGGELVVPVADQEPEACWVTHAPEGWAVIPATCTRMDAENRVTSRDSARTRGPLSQAHIDVLVDDLDAADARVIKLGAQTLTDDVITHEDESFRVYADLDGHPFCLIKQAATDL
jgi:Glyoxalase-like domain